MGENENYFFSCVSAQQGRLSYMVCREETLLEGVAHHRHNIRGFRFEPLKLIFQLPVRNNQSKRRFVIDGMDEHRDDRSQDNSHLCNFLRTAFKGGRQRRFLRARRIGEWLMSAENAQAKLPEVI